MIEPIQFFKSQQNFLVIGYLFDNIVQFGLFVEKAADKIFTLTDKLLVVKFLQRVEVEMFNRLADAYLHSQMCIWFLDLVYNIQMRVEIVRYSDKDRLYDVQNVLMEKWIGEKVDVQKYWERFDQIKRKKSQDMAFALLVGEKEQIVIVASLFAQHKLTRNLCTCVHLEIQYKTCSSQAQLFFQKEVVQLLPGYKITGLQVRQSNTFKPHQIFMDLSYDYGKGKL